mgnify:CR=1 FL=1
MKLIIAGGRDFEPKLKHVLMLNKLYYVLPVNIVVSGTARGGDRFIKGDRLQCT